LRTYVSVGFEDMPDKLVEIARFISAGEASIARNALEVEGIEARLDGEAMATWFWYFGSAIGGVRLWVREDDVEQARQILEAGASRGESADDFDEDEVRDLEAEASNADLPEDLIRAWRAALIGVVLLPPLLNVYSTWLLIRHRFFVDRVQNWRVIAACCVNVVVLSLAAWLIFMIVRPSPSLPSLIPGTSPIEHEKTIRIPLVP